MAAELVGGALLSASLQFLFERLGSPEILAYLRRKSKRCDFDELLGKLKSELNLVSSVLDDAEHKQTKARSIEEWLDMLQDVVFDADDLLDEIETDSLQLKVEADQSKARSSKVLKIRNFFSMSHKSNPNNGDVETKIRNILKRLEYIAKQAGVLNLLKGTVRERPSWRPLPSTSLVDESGVYGREDDKKEIIRLLLSDDAVKEKMSVIPIVGMGGLGKTTLAQVLFNDDQVKEHFELKAWVCVSEEFDVSRVTRTVLAAVSGIYCDDSMDMNSVQVKLKEALTRKKFLIVLDDVWNEKYVDWEVMKMPFKDGAQGSKIIVTTRSEEVASVMRTPKVPTHHLKELDEEVCWQLFAEHAFAGDEFAPNPDFERVGRKIVKKCKGLPLAAKTLGGLLRSKLDIEQWEGISKSDIWELPHERSNILPALRLSYHYLPSHLKRCFAYCSIFPKDFQFEKENLVLLWMAEDLLEHPKGSSKRMEEVGGEYFNDLVARSFFQRSGTGKSCFVMHDLMNDLANFVSRKYCFRLEDGNADEISMKTRHLACVAKSQEESLKLVLKATRLRTFLLLNYNILPDDLFLKLRRLRVLSLSSSFIEHLPDSICREQRFLRYLDLSHTSINRLPESVCMLYNLQTLKLRDCHKLFELPTDFHRLISLRYLDFTNSALKAMPTQMGKLKKLQGLSTFIVGEETRTGSKIGELGELSDLRGRLCVMNLENVVKAEDALEAKLRNKKYLEELDFKWTHYTDYSEVHESERDVLDQLLPRATLKKLEITGYGARKFPNWLGDQLFCNIVDIYLSDCNYCESLPPLGQLSSLKYLDIARFKGVVRVGSEFYGNSSSFKSLEILDFSDMPNWEEWSVPFDNAEAFPKLRELSITHCMKLRGDFPHFLPSLEKLTIFMCTQLTGDLPHFLPSLKELIISYCPQLASSLPVMPLVSTLSLFQCDKLTEYGVLESSSHLQYLRICNSLDSRTCRSLPATLKTLNFNGCERVEFPLLHPYDCPSLTELHFKHCNKLITSGMSSNSQRLPNLTSLTIWKCKFEYSFESFPGQGLLPTTITKLGIYYLEWLKTLDSNGLQQLTSLISLSISYCRNLQTITEQGLPSSLQHFRINGCPLLEEKCEREKGEYWNKISHISEIFFNGELVS